MNLKNLSLIFVCTIFSVFLTVIFVNAWSEPSSPPPQDNVDAPLNVGSDPQYKKGALVLNTDKKATGLIVFGDVILGTPLSSQARLHIKAPDNSWSAGIRLEDDASSNHFDIIYDNAFRIGYNNGTKLTLNTNGNLSVTGSVYGKAFYDSDNTNYYVNPAGDSKFNAIILGGVRKTSWPSLSVSTEYSLFIPEDEGSKEIKMIKSSEGVCFLTKVDHDWRVGFAGKVIIGHFNCEIVIKNGYYWLIGTSPEVSDIGKVSTECRAKCLVF